MPLSRPADECHLKPCKQLLRYCQLTTDGPQIPTRPLGDKKKRLQVFKFGRWSRLCRGSDSESASLVQLPTKKVRLAAGPPARRFQIMTWICSSVPPGPQAGRPVTARRRGRPAGGPVALTGRPTGRLRRARAGPGRGPGTARPAQVFRFFNLKF
jgi:hypothetical protein